MTEPRTTSLADIAGVVIDLAKVPSHDGPPNELRSTGRGYETDNGEVVAYVEVIGDPPVPGYDFVDLSDHPDGES